MIPRLFHQIWIWNKSMPKIFYTYQETWLKLNPGWSLCMWNDENICSLKFFDNNVFLQCVNYSEMSDYLRFCIILEHGWVYLDTDFECLQSIDYLVNWYEFFIWTESAWGGKEFLNSAIFWSVPLHPIIAKIFSDIPWQLKKKHLNNVYKIWPWFVTKYTRFIKNNWGYIFPRNYFDPISWEDYYVGIKIDKNKLINSGAYGIHHYHSSWHVWYLKALEPARRYYIVRFMLKYYVKLKYYIKSFFPHD